MFPFSQRTVILKKPVLFADEGFNIPLNVKEIDFKIDGKAYVSLTPQICSVSQFSDLISLDSLYGVHQDQVTFEAG